MTSELLESLTVVVRELHPANLDRLEAKLANPETLSQAVKMLALELPQPSQREAMTQVAIKWKAAIPAVSSRELAAAIQAMRYAATRQDRAELCWSGPATSLQGFRTTAEAYRELITGATRSALVVSFALGEVETLRESLETVISRGVQVRFILEDFDVFNQKSWQYKFKALGSQVLSGSTIFVWPASARRQREGKVYGSMHVKCLVVDEEAILMTSANWSSAAMHDNMELGVILSGSELAKSVVDHFDHLISSGVLTKASALDL